MELRTRPVTGNPRIVVTPEPGSGWNWVGFSVHRMAPGASLAISPRPGREQAMVLLSGRVALDWHGRVTQIGQRSSVFESIGPFTLYLAPDDAAHLGAVTASEVVTADAPVELESPPSRLFTPDEVVREVRGEGVTERVVHHLLDGPGQAQRLLLVEVLTPAGHWSSFPPHKHDVQDPPREAALEEVYYYRLDPDSGWVVQRIYDYEGMDHTLAVRDGEAVKVPGGYHPVAAPPGVRAYYLNAMAGPRREWHFTVDAAFAHVPMFAVKRESIQDRQR